MLQTEEATNYVACGLNIRSTIPLEGATQGDPNAEPDLHIESISASGIARDPMPTQFQLADGDVHFTTAEVGTIRIRQGRTITIELHEKAQSELTTLRLSVLEPLIAVAMYQRQRLVLHGSAVVVDGRAIVLVGESGSGKSTTAAALFRSGHVVAGDDIAVIDTSGSHIILYPSFPQLKLTSQAAESLGYDPDTLSSVYQQPGKVSLDVAAGFQTLPVQLSRVYVLSKQRHDHPSIVELSQQEALGELLKHSYRFKWLHSLAPGEHLQHCARIAGSSMVFKLYASDSPNSVQESVAMIERHAATEASR